LLIGLWFTSANSNRSLSFAFIAGAHWFSFATTSALDTEQRLWDLLTYHALMTLIHTAPKSSVIAVPSTQLFAEPTAYDLFCLFSFSSLFFNVASVACVCNVCCTCVACICMRAVMPVCRGGRRTCATLPHSRPPNSKHAAPAQCNTCTASPSPLVTAPITHSLSFDESCFD
jgi:hypothetical protein